MRRVRKTSMGFSESSRCDRWTAPDVAAMRRAFTLLEVMISVTIFGIISMAVYSTFRVGLKSYEAGREQMMVTQSARTALDILSRDLRGLHYQPPGAYNRNLIGQMQMRAMRLLQMPQVGGRDRNEEDEERLLPGIPIDLTIVGEDHGEGDALSFATYQAHWGTAAIEPWALARVKYFVQDGNLFRVEGPIAVEKVPSFQTQLMSLLPATPANLGRREEPAPPPPPEDVEHYLADAPREAIARGVKSFDLQYGFWTGGEWYEAPDWCAHERRYRNPPYEIDPKNPYAQIMMNRNLSRPTDDVPAYIIVTLALGYGKDNARTQVYRSRIRLLTSSETYEPFVDPNLVTLTGVPRALRPRSTQVPPELIPR